MALTQQEIEKYNKMFGRTTKPVGSTYGQQRAAEIRALATGEPKKRSIRFWERLGLGFGGEKEKELQQKIERESGLKGRFDIGDIADVMGELLPIAGGVLGGLGGTVLGTPVGGKVGAGVGVAAGESLKQLIGRGLGVRTDIPFTEELKDVALSGLFTTATAGVLSKAGKFLGKPIKVITEKLPERFYSSFFKTTADDLAKQIKTKALANLQKQNPKLFNKLVDSKIIKVSDKGVEIDKTLAREALERQLGTGKTGRSLEKMVGYSYIKQLELEQLIRDRIGNQFISLGKLKNNYIRLLEDLSKEYKKMGGGFLRDITSNLDNIIRSIKNTAGSNIIASDALVARRLIDGLRQGRSFNASVKLAPKQEAYKKAADILRGKINNLEGIGDLMNEYRFYIQSFESLVNEAKRRMNVKTLTLTDGLIGGTSITAGTPLGGAGLMAAFRTIQTPAVLTALGRGLDKLGRVPLPRAEVIAPIISETILPEVKEKAKKMITPEKK